MSLARALLFALLAFSPRVADAAPPSRAEVAAARAYEARVRHFLEVCGAEAQVFQLRGQMRANFQTIAPLVSEELWDELFSEASLREMLDRLVPVYMELLDPADLEHLIAFFESDAGRRFVEKLPLLQARSMEIGQQWGLEIGMRVQRRLDAAR